MLFHRVCPVCRDPAKGVCHRCRSACLPVGEITGLPGLDGGAALFVYDGPARAMIAAAKNRARRDVLRQMGTLAAALVEERSDTGWPPFDAVAWVPASRNGARSRGYDQGQLLARAVSRRSDLPLRRLLVRESDRAQTGLDRRNRARGPRLRALRRSPSAVLLVDDVITTGTSMATASAALRRAGAQAVWGLAVAWNATDGEVAVGSPLAIGSRHR